MRKDKALINAPAYLRRAFWLMCAFLLLITPSNLRSDDRPSIEAASSPASITLDGRLDEPTWRQAPVLKLIQQSPKPGAPTPYDTEVRVIVTRDHIYFGFTCKDPDPRRIAVHTMQRDQNSDESQGDDTVSILLDPYGDHRTGYLFRINAAGARTDGLVSDPESASLDWDGIWDARTARTDSGWSAEVVIPSRTLSFARNIDQWGLNIERFVPRNRLTLRWSSPTLDSQHCRRSTIVFAAPATA